MKAFNWHNYYNGLVLIGFFSYGFFSLSSHECHHVNAIQLKKNMHLYPSWFLFHGLVRYQAKTAPFADLVWSGLVRWLNIQSLNNIQSHNTVTESSIPNNFVMRFYINMQIFIQSKSMCLNTVLFNSKGLLWSSFTRTVWFLWNSSLLYPNE